MSTQRVLAVTVIGDVVRSREHHDQMALLGSLRDLLDRVAQELTQRGPVLQPLGPTIGDEFQGAFKRLDTALHAVLLCQLMAPPGLGLRFGIGQGPIEYPESAADPVGQSGPGWWSARRAIERAEAFDGHRGSMRRSCAFEGEDPTLDRTLEAFLILRDRLVRDLDDIDRAVALGLLRGTPQVEIADAVDIDPAALTRRKRSRRLVELVEAHRALAGEPLP